MERRLRIRIERVSFTHLDVLEEISVSTDHVLEWSHKNKIKLPENIDGFSADVKVERAGYFSSIDKIVDYTDIIVTTKIELNTNLRDSPATTSSLLPQHTVILSAARTFYNSYTIFTEMIDVFDHRDKSHRVFTVPKKPLIGPVKPSIGIAYRLYVNDQLFTQKFYPASLPDSQQLEENVFVDLPAGTHHIRLECLEKENLKINAFACDDQIMTNISVNELSFQIQ